MNELRKLLLEKDFTAFKVKLSCPWGVSVQQIFPLEHIQKICIVEGSDSGYSFIYHHIPGTNILKECKQTESGSHKYLIWDHISEKTFKVKIFRNYSFVASMHNIA